jgi:hypothetical protein
MLFTVATTLLLACHEPEGGTDTAAAEGDPGMDATLTVSEQVGTVAHVTWTTPDAVAAWVEVTEAGVPPRVFPAADDGDLHDALLAGLAAGTTFTWRAVAELADGTTLASAPAVFTTAPPPLWLPSFSVTASSSAPGAGGFVVSTTIGQDSGVFLLDSAGRYVWWWEAEEGLTACQARMSRDGRSVLFMVVDEDYHDDQAAIVRVSLDGTLVSSVRAELGHHDFLETDQGFYAFLALDAREWNGRQVVGDRIVLVDPETGIDTYGWSTWDSLVPTDADLLEGFYTLGADWGHANGLAQDEENGDWVVSLHNLDAVVRVDAAGRLRWQLGGRDGDFTLTGGEAFAAQHSPALTDAGILLFDNRGPNDAELYSQAAEYTIDEDAGTYAPTWTFDGDGKLFSIIMGSAERLPNGNTLVGWGSSGRINEVTPDGEVVWQDDAAIGSPLAFAHWTSTLGEERDR